MAEFYFFLLQDPYILSNQVSCFGQKLNMEYS